MMRTETWSIWLTSRPDIILLSGEAVIRSDCRPFSLGGEAASPRPRSRWPQVGPVFRPIRKNSFTCVSGQPMTRCRVLLIDDHDNIRFGLRCLFEAQGHTVQEADDGLDGVRKARAWRPHVAVVDIDMPLLDGYGVARQIRQAL